MTAIGDGRYLRSGSTDNDGTALVAHLPRLLLLVGLGAMIGKILEVTGGAKVLADTLIGRFR